MLIISAAIAVLVLLVAIAGTRTSGPFSPDSTDASGAKALAVLLGNHNVSVESTDDLSDAVDPRSGSTLLIAPGGSLDANSWNRIHDARWEHLVLVRPGSVALETLAPGVRMAGTVPTGSRSSGCDIAPSQRAGTATVGGMTYSAPAGADSCYGDGIHGSIVRIEDEGRLIDVVGTPTSFSNDHLADDGNAALGLDLIGTDARLVWYLPRYESDAPGNGGDDTEEGVIPGWVRYVVWMIAFAAVVTALWRGRRLGPVVPEALPVVVHAAETTEGRARLYRRSRARDRAAAALRDSTLARLRKAIGIGRLTDPAGVVDAVAVRTGRDPAVLYDLLYGGPPYDDTALLNLSRELDALTQEVRRP